MDGPTPVFEVQPPQGGYQSGQEKIVHQLLAVQNEILQQQKRQNELLYSIFLELQKQSPPPRDNKVRK